MDASSYFVTYFVVYLIVNVVLSIVVANLAIKKGRSGGGFFALSFFISFVIALIVVLLISPIEHVKTSGVVSAGDRVKCPHCAEPILAEAKVCKHCGRDVEPHVVEGPAPLKPAPDAGSAWCNSCESFVSGVDAEGGKVDYCPSCGAGSSFLSFA